MENTMETTIMENQMEKKMENEMETGGIFRRLPTALRERGAPVNTSNLELRSFCSAKKLILHVRSWS